MKNKLFFALGTTLALLCSAPASAANMYEQCRAFAGNIAKKSGNYESYNFNYDKCLIKSGANWLEADKNSFSIKTGNGKKIKFRREDEDGYQISYYEYISGKNMHHITKAHEDFSFSVLVDGSTGDGWELNGPLFQISPQSNRVVTSTYIEAAGPCGPVISVLRLIYQAGGETLEEKIPKNQVQFCSDENAYSNKKTRTSFLAESVSWLTNESFDVDWACQISGSVEKEYKDKTRMSFNGNAWSIDHTPCQLNAAASPSSSGITYGMKIVGVRSDSAAAAAGLRPGMFLLTLNGEPINQVSDARRVNEQGQKSVIQAVALVNGQKRSFNIMPHLTTLGLDLCELSKCKP